MHKINEMAACTMEVENEALTYVILIIQVCMNS